MRMGVETLDHYSEATAIRRALQIFERRFVYSRLWLWYLSLLSQPSLSYQVLFLPAQVVPALALCCICTTMCLTLESCQQLLICVLLFSIALLSRPELHVPCSFIVAPSFLLKTSLAAILK
jgi:hypothetical protein